MEIGFWWVSLLRFFRQAHGARADTRARTGSRRCGVCVCVCVCVCVWGWGGTHGDSVARIREENKPCSPVIRLCAGDPALFTTLPRPSSRQPGPHTNPWPLPGRGLHPPVCVFSLQSYWVVRIDLDTGGGPASRTEQAGFSGCLLEWRAEGLLFLHGLESNPARGSLRSPS